MRIRIPRKILMDQGSNFSSKLMQELCKLLRIEVLKTSVYHPQINGLVEQFHGILKAMLRKFIDTDPHHWD